MNRYLRLLEITDGHSSPDFFELLGIPREENRPAIIKAAAIAQINKLRRCQGGPHQADCKELTAEIKRAFQVLTQPEPRARYLAKLHSAAEAPANQKDASIQPNDQAKPIDPQTTENSGTLRLIVGSVAVALLVGVLVTAFLWMRNDDQPIAADSMVPSSNAELNPPAVPVRTLPVRTLPGSLAAVAGQTSVVPTVDEQTQVAPLAMASSVPVSPADRSTASDRLPKKSASDSPPLDSTPAAMPDELPELVTAETASQLLPTVGDDEIAKRACAVLQRNCFRCHGENEADEGGFNFALEREKLVYSGFVIPDHPNDSPLLQRMTSTDSPMPPEGETPRPNGADVQVIKDWIQSGAKAFTDSVPHPIVTTDQMHELIATDLESIKANERVYTRYFSANHLSNAGYSLEEIQLYRLALAKLLNSLSWNRQLAGLHVVPGLSAVYRIDLRDLKWTDRTWATILENYPYAIVHQSLEATQIRKETKSEVPIVRADWFVSTASRPPLYHDLAQIPDTDSKLEQILHVDVDRNIKEKRLIRIGFTRSGVSQNNRLIERHESAFGAYWKSYDFAGSTGRKNLFDFPMGPGETASDFDHDGGEIIFQLPNGMLAYMLTDKDGRRIDKGPASIVSDPRQPDRAVVNGVSCMSCHYGGFIQKADEIRRHVTANRSAFPNSDAILEIYQDSDAGSRRIAGDTAAYLKALGSDPIGIKQPTRAGEPIVLAALRYNNELDLPLAAWELGVTPQSLSDQLSSNADASLSRRLGALTIKGGVVKRSAFVDSFFQLAGVMNLGPRAITADPGPAPQVAGNARPNAIPARRVAITSMPFGNDPVAAKRTLATAVQMMRSLKWRDAGPQFDLSIKQATTPTLRLRACESAIVFYQRLGSVESLLGAYQYILESCRTDFEIKRVRDKLFQSLNSVVAQMSPERPPSEFDWPLSVSREIAATFEPRLAESPNHEPTLRVLQTYYGTIHDDRDKRKEVLERLDGILKSRKQMLELESGLVLAELLVDSGDAERGAEIIHRYIEFTTGTRAATLMQNEAAARIKADDKPKAMVALKRAQKLWQIDHGRTSGIQLGLIGDAFMELGERSSAVDAYKLAIRLEKNPAGIQRIQQQLAIADAERKPRNNGDEPAESMDDLLDPGRKFRIEAEQYENTPTRDASSRFRSMKLAAESWIKSGDNARATSAIDKAATANRRIVSFTHESNCAQLAELYLNVGQKQKAMEQWIRALQTTTRPHSISNYQVKIDSLIQEDASLDVHPEWKSLLDANYQYRVQAKEAEAMKASNASSGVMQKTRAAEFWQQAGEPKEAKRCAAVAESLIKRVNSQSDYPPEAGMYGKLADIYRSLSLPDDEIRNLLGAMKFAHNDDHVVRDYHRISEICEANSLPKPKLDGSVSLRLDPLNRFRVLAAKNERLAKTQSSSLVAHHLRSAIANWLKADERENAIRVCNDWAKQAMKDKTDSQFEQNCMKLAEFFSQLDRKAAAIKCYEEALLVTKYDFRKKEIQKQLDLLNADQN